MLTRHSRWRNCYHACTDAPSVTEHGGDSDAEFLTREDGSVAYALSKTKHPFTGEAVACAQSHGASTVSPGGGTNRDNPTTLDWVVCGSAYRDGGSLHKEVSVGWAMTQIPRPAAGTGVGTWPWREDDDQETLAGPIRILRKPSGHRGTVIGRIKWRGKGSRASSRTSVALRFQPGWLKQYEGLLVFPVVEMPDGWPDGHHSEGPVTLHGLRKTWRARRASDSSSRGAWRPGRSSSRSARRSWARPCGGRSARWAWCRARVSADRPAAVGRSRQVPRRHPPHTGEGAARRAVSLSPSCTQGYRPVNFLWALLLLAIGGVLLWLAFADPGSAQALIDRYAWW